MKRKAIFVQSKGILGCIGGKSSYPTVHAGSSAKTASGPVKALVLGLGESQVIDRHMPFAGVPGYVTVPLQGTGQSPFVFGHPSAVPGGHHRPSMLMVGGGRSSSHNMGFLGSSGVVATHDGASRWSTGGSRGIGLPKLNTLFCQGIDVGGLHRGRLIDVIAFDVLPAKVIG